MKVEEMLARFPNVIPFNNSIYYWRIKKKGSHYCINYIGKRPKPKAPYPILWGVHDRKFKKAVEKMYIWLEENNLLEL